MPAAGNAPTHKTRQPENTAVRERTIAYLRLADIRGAEVNPKQHDRIGIRRSVATFGLGELPLLDERTDRIVAGHGRVDDLREHKAAGGKPPPDVRVDDDGEWLIPVQAGWSSADDAHARAYVAASNKLSENGGWDRDLLPAYLGDLDTHGLLELTGFTDGELADLLDLGTGPDDEPSGPPDTDVDERAREVIGQAILDELTGDTSGWQAAADAAVKRLRAEALLAD